MIILYTGILLILYSVISQRVHKYDTFIALLFCFVIMGFQSNVDGDFYSYKHDFENFGFYGHVLEKGEYFWLYLNYLCQSIISWPIFVVILSGFECYIIKKYIDRFANCDYKFVSAVLFFFTFNYMLMQMKAMRQGLALELSIYALLMIQDGIEYKKSKDILIAVLLSLAAYYSHHSSLILIAFVWGYYFVTRSKTFINWSPRSINFSVIFGIAGYLLFVMKKSFLDNILFPYLSLMDDSQYEAYLQELIESAGIVTNLVVLYDVVILFLLGWYLKIANGSNKYITIIAIVGMFADIICFGNSSVQRILLYFSIFNLVVFPQVLSEVEKQYGKIPAYVLIFFLVGYAMKTSVFWLVSGDPTMFGQYKFIFQ